MKIQSATIDDYVRSLPEDKKEGYLKLREVIKKNIPKGFEEVMAYGMISYVVPLKTYPDGYHCNPSLPLMFVSLACQKNFISLHHLGIYGNAELLNWFVEEYPKHSKIKLDMGKGCIRFKKPDQIPLELIGELMQKMSMQEWIDYYDKAINTHLKSKQKK